LFFDEEWHMSRTLIALSLPLFISLAAWAEERQNEQPSGPADRYEALLTEYEDIRRPRQIAPKFLEFAARNSNAPQAVDALVWVVVNLRHGPETTRAFELLEKDHLKNEQLAAACPHVARTALPAGEKLLRAALENSPHIGVQAQACFYLAALLDQQADLALQLRKQPELTKRVQQYYGKELSEHLATLDVEKVKMQREKLYDRMLESFADLPAQDGTMGQYAAKALFSMRHLSVGKIAPEIDADDIDGKSFKLSDYRGKVVLISFWGHW
jgi:hypothetical protein